MVAVGCVLRSVLFAGSGTAPHRAAGMYECLARVHYAILRQQTAVVRPPGGNAWSGRAGVVCVFHRVTAVMAGRKHPVTFRTRKLSFSAPMVLHSGGCGRVGHRRTIFPGRAPTLWLSGPYLHLGGFTPAGAEPPFLRSEGTIDHSASLYGYICQQASTIWVKYR